jgi:transmembrane sensor
MQKEDIKAIWDHYKTGKASAEELALLENWYLEYEHSERELLTEKEIGDRIAAVAAQLPLKRPVIKLWGQIAAAAAMFFVLSVGILFYRSQTSGLNGQVSIVDQIDLKPGKNTATLTLANGKTIKLSDTKSGIIVNGEQMIYNDSSAVSHSIIDNDADNSSHVESNQRLTASTPRGGQYQIVLPDGTKVWLNAATSLQFPQHFAGAKERRVVLIGEAYFEVAKDKAHPFIVKTAKQEVEVLGTHFNIDSYADESSVKTTLLEGSVRLRDLRSNDTQLLKPGQQAVLNHKEQLTVSEVDLDQAVAWKNGVFYFYRADLKSVMRQLARWYNVDVAYEGVLPEHEFTGKIFKKVNASEALNILTELDVKFKIDGRKIIVSP